VVDYHVQPLPTMVATKIALPLYLVVGPGDIADSAHVSGEKIAIFTIPDVDLKYVRTFATRDLKNALELYFSQVHVVYDEALVPKNALHVRAQAKISKIEYDRRVTQGAQGQQNELFAAVEWAFGLKLSDQPDFLFNFAERSTSSVQMKSFSDTAHWESAFQEALRHMLAEYTKHGIHQKLLEHTPAAPRPAS
jgi:hypothetical protein